MNTPRVRWPLSTKILVGLGLNVALLAAAFAIVFVVQVRLNPSWLLAGSVGKRLQATAQLLAGDLAFANADNVQGILDRYREAYQMDLRLFDMTGRAVAGPDEPIPPEVLVHVGRTRGPQSGRGGPRGPADGQGIGPRGAQELPRGPRGRGQGPYQQAFPRFVVRAGVPVAYWVVIQLPAAGEFRPLTLVVRSESLWSGALLLDIKPWLAAAAGALALSGLFWFPLMRGITRDVGHMMRGTETIASGEFGWRLDLRRSDELGRLADAIDAMAGRLAGFVAGQKRFLGDAAHELCSPLARMQAAIAILDSRDHGESNGYIADLREELDEMAALVNELLAFSRASHGRSIALEPTNVRAVIDRAWNREAPADARLDLAVDPSVVVEADPGLLQRAIANLIRNAIRYAGTQESVTISARNVEGGVEVSVADLGPGVPADALPRLFEPFFRPEPSRSRELGGVGLGLAIVRTCVEACRGSVTARNRVPRGFEVLLHLRRASTN
ncbi:MAG: sensor histidine kinase [Limisphaerales bacterium]